MMDNKGTVLFVEDEHHVRLAGKQTLELAGFSTVACASAEEALTQLTPDWSGVVVTDIRMPGMSGLDLMSRCLELDPDLPVILITGHGDVVMAVTALKAGAYDFLEKPFRSDLMLDSVERALEKRKLIIENRALRRELSGQRQQSPMFGRTPAMEHLRDVIANIATTDADVLLEGETGVGKELVAHALHQLSPRRERPFVALNCGAMPETIIESELFGHESGSFTGARSRRIGKFEHASGGTLFLDEIESMPLSVGVRLLRVLQERVVERLGSNQLIPIDIRVIAATKTDLKELSDGGQFRADLYYRLNVVKIEIPPLRQRREDIPLLFQHFVEEAAERHGREPPLLEPGLLSGLMARDWPGNVRELQNAAERLVIGYGQDLSAADEDATQSLPEQVSAFEKSLIEQELRRQKGNVTATQRALGIPRKTLYDKLNRYGLRRENFVTQPSTSSR
jgi:two-component system C4-dicarboxylate transport response regulator DctD